LIPHAWRIRGWAAGVVLAVVSAVVPDVAAGQDIRELRVKAEGRLVGTELVADRIRTRDPRRDRQRAQIAGRIGSVDLAARTFTIGPVRVDWSAATRFDGVDETQILVGASVEARGVVLGSRHLRADGIEPGPEDPDRVEIIASVSRRTPLHGGGERLMLLGVSIRIPPTLRLSPVSLTRDPDDRRPDDPISVDIFGRPLQISGELGARLGFRGDFALDDDEEDDRLQVDPELKLELFYEASRTVSLFVEGKGVYERDLAREGGGRRQETVAERGESWLFLSLPEKSGLALMVGRQTFREDREWWWDDDLDAIRLWWTGFPLALQLGVGRELFSVSTANSGILPEQEDVLRVVGRASWSWRPGHILEAFALGQWDSSGVPQIGARIDPDREDPIDGDLWWLGLRATGELDLGNLGELDYWLDLAHVRGSETIFTFGGADRARHVLTRESRDVFGWGLDVGVTWEVPLSRPLWLTVGYALGTGAHSGRGGFRQTGLQDNNGRFRGVNRFRYYGELLDPELSNLQILTLSVGMPILRSSSIEFVYHSYWQHRSADFLRDTRIRAAPIGRHRGLGQELDFVVGLEEWERIELEVVASVFRAGRAFGPLSGEFAFGGFVKMEFNF